MMRQALSGFLLGVLLAAVPVGLAANATTLAPMTDEQLTDAATYVVEGDIAAVWAEVDDTGLVWTRASVDVTHTYKGPDSPDHLTVDSMGGTLGQARMVMPAAARFSAGEHVILFLSEVDHGRRLAPVAAFLGKYTVRRAPGDRRHHVMRWQTNDGPYDHRFLPHPAPERRVYYDDLIERVETRLDTGWDGTPIPGISAEKLEHINTADRRMR